ncbi:MAG: ferredoxin reductase family protein [Magnetovibrionaceae bacterium]
MRPLGLALIAIAILLPLIWFVPLWVRDPLAVFSQYLGSAALIGMGVAMVMAIRWKPLEAVFGGQDQIYRQHKWLAIGSMAAILLHDTIDADMRGVGPETLLTDLGETLGELSLYGLLILVTVTLATFIPYHLWRWTHRFMGAFFAFGAIHYLLILKPFKLMDPPGLYVSAFCVAGLLAYAVTLIPFRKRAGAYGYSVSSVQKEMGGLVVELSPDGRPLAHRAGQFAFLGFDLDGLDEVHPFTISAAPRADGVLRFSIGPLGDYTQRLAAGLQPGTKAKVTGPHGHFRPLQNKPQAWIAAGIGITPFLAWAGEGQAAVVPVHLFYCVRGRERALHLDELEAWASASDQHHLHVIDSLSRGRLDAADVLKATGESAADLAVSFCGPKAMGDGLQKALVAAGLKSSAFHREAFEIRSGLPFGKAIEWLIKRFVKPRLKMLRSSAR